MTKIKTIPDGIRSTTLFLILITPAFTNLMEHAGSSIMVLLTLIGIYAFIQQGRIEYIISEKVIMGVFVLYFIFSLMMILAHNFLDGVSIFKLHIDHEIRMLTIIPIYYLFVQSRLAKGTIWYSVLAGAVASGLYALFAAISIDFSDRIIGPYNPCLFGYFSVALAFMSLSGYHFFYKMNKKLVLLPLFGFACGLLAAFFSGTRGSVITIPFLTLIFIFQIRQHLKSFNAKIVISAMAAIFVFLLFLFPHLYLAERFEKGIDEARDFIKNHERVNYIGEYEAHHLRMWMEAAIIIKDHPFFGVGPKGYRQIVTNRVNTGQIAPGIEIFDEPHNFYLNMWTSYGIASLMILLAFFLTPLAVLIHAIRTAGDDDGSRDMAWCGVYLITGYMLFSLTGTLFNRNMLITFYLVMLAAILSVYRPAAPRAIE